MKKIIMGFILIACIPTVNAEEYVKQNGILSLFMGNNGAEFNINASHGDTSGVCSLEGIAQSVGAGAGQLNRWVYSDSASTCVAIISEITDGSVNVMIRSCENYCGFLAEGSVDGIYMKK